MSTYIWVIELGQFAVRYLDKDTQLRSSEETRGTMSITVLQGLHENANVLEGRCAYPTV